MCRYCPDGTCSFQRGWSHHPSTAATDVEVVVAAHLLDINMDVDEDGGKPIHKIYNPSKEKDYFYSLLLLFVPFRNEGDLIEEGETAESALNRHMEENGALNTHSEKLQRMLKAKESVQKINEARQAQQQDVKGPDQGEEDDDDDVGRQVKPRRPCTMCWNSIRVSSLSSVCTKG